MSRLKSQLHFCVYCHSSEPSRAVQSVVRSSRQSTKASSRDLRFCLLYDAQPVDVVTRAVGDLTFY